MKLNESPIERLFGPCDRRLSPCHSHESFGHDTSGEFIVAVTPPRALRMPTAFVRLSCDEMEGFRQWLYSKEPIEQCLPYITKTQRDILLNGMDTSEEPAQQSPHSNSKGTPKNAPR